MAFFFISFWLSLGTCNVSCTHSELTKAAFGLWVIALVWSKWTSSNCDSRVTSSWSARWRDAVDRNTRLADFEELMVGASILCCDVVLVLCISRFLSSSILGLSRWRILSSSRHNKRLRVWQSRCRQVRRLVVHAVWYLVYLTILRIAVHLNRSSLLSCGLCSNLIRIWWCCIGKWLVRLSLIRG